MLSIPHMLTGAFIASKLPHPALYIPLTFAAHYLQDWIPHWDVGTGLSSGRRRRSTAILLELADLALSIGLVFLFFGPMLRESQDNMLGIHIWIGALAGIAPDLLEAPRNFLRWEPRFIKPLNELHGFFHHSTHHKCIGLLPQVITVVAIWLLR